MQKINSATGLREAILQLEIAHAEEGRLLKEQFNLAYESVKPINLIKNTFREVVASPGLIENILNTSVGLVAGYLSRLLFVNVSHSPLRKMLGIALQFGVTKLVAKNPEGVRSFGKILLKNIMSKFAHSANEAESN